VALTTTLLSSTSIRANGIATAAQVGTKVPIIVTNTGLGGTTSTLVNLSVTAAAPVTVQVSPSSASVAATATQQFTATVTGSTNTSVTWGVNGVTGGNSTVGAISTTGLYTAPAAPPNPATVTIRAISGSSGGNATVTIAGLPNPGAGQGTGNLSAARFLEQAFFGPTPTGLTHVKQVGIDAWLAEQFNAPETQIFDLGS